MTSLLFRYLQHSSIACLYACVASMVGFSEAGCDSQKSVMLEQMALLERQAYSLAGRSFSLSAADDVAQVTSPARRTAAHGRSWVNDVDMCWVCCVVK